jgi:hypothetical protein
MSDIDSDCSTEIEEPMNRILGCHININKRDLIINLLDEASTIFAYNFNILQYVLDHLNATLKHNHIGIIGKRLFRKYKRNTRYQFNYMYIKHNGTQYLICSEKK